MKEISHLVENCNKILRSNVLWITFGDKTGTLQINLGVSYLFIFCRFLFPFHLIQVISSTFLCIFSFPFQCQSSDHSFCLSWNCIVPNISVCVTMKIRNVILAPVDDPRGTFFFFIFRFGKIVNCNKLSFLSIVYSIKKPIKQ